MMAFCFFRFLFFDALHGWSGFFLFYLARLSLSFLAARKLLFLPVFRPFERNDLL